MFLIPERATHELQRLQASLAREMSYRRAAEILRRFLPVSSSHNHATVRNRTLRLGERLQAAGHCPAAVSQPGVVRAPTEVTLAIDGGLVRLQPAADIRNFEILTGRIAYPGEKPYVFAWVRREGGPMQERLTALMRAKTAAPAPEVKVITDGGNGVQHLHRLLPGKRDGERVKVGATPLSLTPRTHGHPPRIGGCERGSPQRFGLVVGSTDTRHDGHPIRLRPKVRLCGDGSGRRTAGPRRGAHPDQEFVSP